MIQQVRMRETYTPTGATSASTRDVFAFGTHPMATEAEQHPVMSATVSGNKLRVIVDELLVGNNLEEIACRSNVDTDAYQRVPLGATPDDIASCSTPQDVLPRTCKGEHAVCICQLDGGCTVGSETVEKGLPVGVLDINQDGSADDTRLAEGAVALRCGSIDVPIDLDNSYWYPSGNQQVPARGGFDALGPAIVIVPLRGLPTNVECQLQFADDIVDKQGERLCAPANGNVDAGCAAGDVSAFKFRAEPLVFITDPADGATGVSRSAQVVLAANTNLDQATLTNITINPTVAFTTTLMMNKNIIMTFGAQLAANTQYTVTVPTSVHDTFGQGAPAPITLTFTTGAN